MYRLTAIITMTIALLLSGCGNELEQRRTALQNSAQNISAVFSQARQGVVELAGKAATIFSNQLPQVTSAALAKYRYYEDTAYYKERDDGLCGLWASGLIPIKERQKQRILALEDMQPAIRQNVEDGNYIDQSYILTKDHIAIYYPFFNGVTYFEPKLDFYQAFKPFYEPSPKYNPQKEPVWVKPYIDATGKGYIVSIAAPVYANGEFEASVGSDLRIMPIGEAFLDMTSRQMIITEDSLVVAITPECSDLIDFKGLGKFYYLQHVKKDEAAPDQFKLGNASNKTLREIARRLLAEEQFTVTLDNTRYTVMREVINVPGWHLVEFIPN